MSLQKLVDLVNKLRIVKHGDIILSDDHNSLVNVSKAIQEIILPSGICPGTLSMSFDIFDNFLSPHSGEIKGVGSEIGVYLISNVCDISLSKQYIPRLPDMSGGYIPAWSMGINYYTTPNVDVIVDLFATVSKAIPPGDVDLDIFSIVYDLLYFTYTYYGVKFSGLVYLLYTSYSSYIVVLDFNNYKVSQYEEAPIVERMPHTIYKLVFKDVFFDWMITELKFPNILKVCDKGGNELISYKFEGKGTQSEPTINISSGSNYAYSNSVDAGVENIIPLGNTYDWIGAKLSSFGIYC